MTNLKMDNSILRTLKLGAVVALGLSIAGCTSKTAEEAEYSGFLSDYSQLQETKIDDGAVLLAWENPDIAKHTYTKVMIDPVVLHPKPKPGSQIREEMLDNLLLYLNKALRDRVGKNHEIVSVPGKDVLRVKTAVTGVRTTSEELSAYEYLPIALIWAGATTATGNRSQAVEILLEVESSDSLTGEVMGAGVRKGFGESVSNTKEQVEVENVRPLLDNWADALVPYLDRVLK